MQINYFNMKLNLSKITFPKHKQSVSLIQSVITLQLRFDQSVVLFNNNNILLALYHIMFISCILVTMIGTISWFNSSLDWSVRKSLVTSSHMETMYNSYTISNEIYLILSIMMSFLKFYYRYIWICIIFPSQGFLGSNLSTVTVYIHFEDIKLISPIHLPVLE